MSANTVSKSIQHRSLVLGAFNLKWELELSAQEIQKRVKETSGEKIGISAIGSTLLYLTKEDLLTSKNGPPYPHRRGEENRGRIKLFSLKQTT